MSAEPSSSVLAIEQFCNEVVRTYLRLKVFGEEIGLSHPLGNNVATLLSMLYEKGGLAVAQSARVLGVSRQYAIRLARQLENDGIVVLRREEGTRGFTMELTEAGREQVRTRADLFHAHLQACADGMDGASVAAARQTLLELSRRLERSTAKTAD